MSTRCGSWIQLPSHMFADQSFAISHARKIFANTAGDNHEHLLAGCGNILNKAELNLSE